MCRIIIAMGLVAIGTVPVAAQTSAPKPLPAATVARMRYDAEQLRQEALGGSPSQRPAGRRGWRAPAPAFTPRPPKRTPASAPIERGKPMPETGHTEEGP